MKKRELQLEDGLFYELYEYDELLCVLLQTITILFGKLFGDFHFLFLYEFYDYDTLGVY